jgi:hypothetical protein
MRTPKSIVAITWDGKSSPMDHIHFDVDPAFDWLLYEYSGLISEAPIPVAHYISCLLYTSDAADDAPRV